MEVITIQAKIENTTPTTTSDSSNENNTVNVMHELTTRMLLLSQEKGQINEEINKLLGVPAKVNVECDRLAPEVSKLAVSSNNQRGTQDVIQPVYEACGIAGNNKDQ
jgi:hypothetical protein